MGQLQPAICGTAGIDYNVEFGNADVTSLAYPCVMVYFPLPSSTTVL